MRVTALTEDELLANVSLSEGSANLDNGKSAQTNVQVSREMRTPNGCHITLVFPFSGRADVRRRITELLLSTIVREEVVNTK